LLPTDLTFAYPVLTYFLITLRVLHTNCKEKHVAQYKEAAELITYLQEIAIEWQGYLDVFYTGAKSLEVDAL